MSDAMDRTDEDRAAARRDAGDALSILIALVALMVVGWLMVLAMLA